MSPIGTSRHFAAPQQFGRFQTEADTAGRFMSTRPKTCNHGGRDRVVLIVLAPPLLRNQVWSGTQALLTGAPPAFVPPYPPGGRIAPPPPPKLNDPAGHPRLSRVLTVSEWQ